MTYPSTSQGVVVLPLGVQLLGGGDDSRDGVDDEAFLCHSSVHHVTVWACVWTQKQPNHLKTSGHALSNKRFEKEAINPSWGRFLLLEKF